MKNYALLFAIVTILGIAFLYNPQVVNQEKEAFHFPPRPQHVDDRQWHRIKMRGGKLETNKIIKGREYVEEQLASSKKRTLKDGALRTWSSRGPGNVPGRIRAMIFKRAPDKLLVGTAGGGIWTLDFNTKTWSPVNDFLPSLAVTSFAMSNIFSPTIYASTGEGHASQTMGLPGAGIFKSTDSGTSWSQINSTSNEEFYWVNKIDVNPSNVNHILAVTSQADKNGFPTGGKLKESMNGGNTWTDVLTTNGFLTDVHFDRGDASIRVVSGIGELWIYNSTSDSYEDKSSQINNYDGRVEIEIAPSDPDTMYVQVNTLNESLPQARYISINGGSTWTFMGSSADVFGTNLGNYANTVWIDPLNASNVYFGGLDLYRSIDAGISLTKISDWTHYHTNGDDGNTPQLHGDQHIILNSPYYTSSNQYVYIGNDGGIQATANISSANNALIGNASGWINLNYNSLGSTQFYSASASPVNSKIGGGTQDNSFITRNSNNTWFQHNTGDGSMMLFHPTNADIIYANTNNNGLWKSTDGGDNYSMVANLDKPEAELIAPISINPSNPDLVYLGGRSLWVYDDSNGSLTSIKAPFSGSDVYITAIEISEDGNDIWVGYDQGPIHVSFNGGLNWNTNSVVENSIITDIAINNDLNQPGGEREIVITSGGYRQENISLVNYDPSVSFPTFPFQTTDISLPFDIQVNSVTYHPNNKNWIYVGTDVGIFASENKGITWSVTPIETNNDPVFNNEGPVYTEVSELFWVYDSFTPGWILGAATFGRGVFTSNAILDTIFVDRNYGGPFYFGSRQKPKNTFRSALAQAENTGAAIHFISGGTHEEIGTIISAQKRVVITGSATSSVVE